MRSRRRAPAPLGPRVKIIDRIAHPFSELVEDQTATQRTIAFEGVSFATHVIGTRLGELYAAVAAIVALTGLPLDVRFPLYLFRNQTDCFPPIADIPHEASSSWGHVALFTDHCRMQLPDAGKFAPLCGQTVVRYVKT